MSYHIMHGFLEVTGQSGTQSYYRCSNIVQAKVYHLREAHRILVLTEDGARFEVPGAHENRALAEVELKKLLAAINPDFRRV